MPRVYRYAFDRQVPFSEVLDTLNLAVIGAECLHGESRVRLDARFVNDPAQRAVVIDTTTHIGKVLNTLFAGLAIREFGDSSFSVVRNPAPAKKGRP